ncbi:hypothetical protein D3C76_1517490 [compost metagenome]
MMLFTALAVVDASGPAKVNPTVLILPEMMLLRVGLIVVMHWPEPATMLNILSFTLLPCRLLRDIEPFAVEDT